MSQKPYTHVLPPIVDQNGQPIKVSGIQLHLHTMMTSEETKTQLYSNPLDGIIDNQSPILPIITHDQIKPIFNIDSVPRTPMNSPISSNSNNSQAPLDYNNSQFTNPINSHARGPSKIPLNQSITLHQNNPNLPTKDKVCAYLYPNDQSSYNECMNRLRNLYPQFKSTPISNKFMPSSGNAPPMSTENYQKLHQACLQQFGYNEVNARKCDHAIILENAITQ
jgi:hypothetical protein